MLSQAEINELKRKHGKIFAVDVEAETCIFRRLKVGEFNKITASHSGQWKTADAEDAIVEAALLYPPNLNTDNLSAGVISSLAEQILEASDFEDDIDHLNAVLEEKRVQNDSFHKMMLAFILVAMPKYTLEELEDRTFGELLDLLALAEAILRIQKDIYNPNIAEIKLNVKSQQEEEQGEYSQENDPIIQKLLAAMPNAPKAPPMKVPRGTQPHEVEIEYE